jgi:hypothetical protein
LGVLAGLGALTRSEISLLIPGFAIVSALMCRRRGRSIWPAAAILLAGITTLLPWSIYNVNRFDESVFLSTNDGSTLLGANCDGSYYREIGGWDLLCLAPLEPVGIGHDPGEPDASERSLARRERALVYINSNAERLPVVMAARIARTLDVYGLSSVVAHDVGDDKDEWVSWAGIVSFWVLTPLAVAGWMVLSRRKVGTRWWLLVPVCSSPSCCTTDHIGSAPQPNRRWYCSRRWPLSWRGNAPDQLDRLTGTPMVRSIHASSTLGCRCR